MRVLVFSHSYVVAANHAKLEHLARMPDMDLSLICPRRVRRELMTVTVQRTEHPDYQIVPLRTVYPSHNYRFFYWTAGRAIARLAPDLLHVEEEPWSLAAWQAVRACRGQKRGHSPFRPPWGRRRLLRRKAECPLFCPKIVFFTWQNLRRRYGWPHEAIEREVHAAADAAIAGNAEAAEILREKGFTKPVHVLPQFGVDESRYAKRDERALRRELALRGVVVGFAGRFVPEKGVELLLEACSGLEGDWSLLLVGGGPLRRELEGRLRQPPFAGRAALLDAVRHDEMPRYLSCMDVLVLPSQAAAHWKEQFGHVLIEAMACEVPVVGSTCGEIPHVVGDAGLVFPEGDAKGLRDALGRLLASPQERAALAARGRQRVLAHYTDARIAAATHAIYREVMAR